MIDSAFNLSDQKEHHPSLRKIHSLMISERNNNNNANNMNEHLSKDHQICSNFFDGYEEGG
jgi:hypothetical protein